MTLFTTNEYIIYLLSLLLEGNIDLSKYISTMKRDMEEKDNISYHMSLLQNLKKNQSSDLSRMNLFLQIHILNPDITFTTVNYDEN